MFSPPLHITCGKLEEHLYKRSRFPFMVYEKIFRKLCLNNRTESGDFGWDHKRITFLWSFLREFILFCRFRKKVKILWVDMAIFPSRPKQEKHLSVDKSDVVHKETLCYYSNVRREKWSFSLISNFFTLYLIYAAVRSRSFS